MPPERLDFEALGTTCHLFGVGVVPERLAEGRRWVLDLHRRLTRFEPASELSLFNAGAGSWLDVSPELEALLREALRAHEASGGLVHAGVLGPMLSTGYTRPLVEGPTLAVLTVPRPLTPLPDVLEVLPGRARLRAGSGIDLGGLAKGWMADRLAERMGANVLVNLGGDLRARGGGPDGEGWSVGLGAASVLLADQGAATSSVRRRRWGDGLHHLIDPRTGRPAETDLGEVSVLAGSAADAEVVAKTALLLGAEAAPAFLAARSPGWWMRPL